MFTRYIVLPLVLAALAAGWADVPLAARLQGGKLIFERDAQDNTIPDFSNCGYRGGGVDLPDVPVKETLQPSDGDAGARIQAALDKVAALPLDGNGFRGAVLLKKGEYKIAGTLQINASGVVLRGEGDKENETVLIAAGTTKRTLINIGGGGKPREIKGSRRSVTADYVPCGARAIPVEGAADFKPGDHVMVFRPCTAEWVHELGMDHIPPKKDGGKVTQWHAGSEELRFDREITKIDGNTLYVDAPITCALEKKFGGGYVYKYEAPERIAQCGIERLRGVSEYKDDTDEEHAWVFVAFNNIENGWAREITSLHFG